ncbi:MAG TPA: hypothetical protein VFI70_10870 [Nitrososphaeraceae archaeon]|nr:hypothetical protein [Nitrososphaeraceae archaeon]
MSDIHNYFSILQKDDVSIIDYIDIRKEKHPEIIVVKSFAEGASTDQNQFISVVKDIEKNELLELIGETNEEPCNLEQSVRQE